MTMIDLEIRKDFFEIAQQVGCLTQISGFVSEINQTNVNYPLFLITPLTSKEKWKEHQEDIYSITMYFFELYADESHEKEPTEERVWQLYSRVSARAKLFKRKLLEDYLGKYNLSGDYMIERNALSLGNDETVFVKVTFTCVVYYDCSPINIIEDEFGT